MVTLVIAEATQVPDSAGYRAAGAGGAVAGRPVGKADHSSLDQGLK
jgi:hypothetical protein